jgi:hypothetical protein
MFTQIFNSSVFCNQYCFLPLFYSKILSINVNMDFFMVITVFVVEMVIVIAVIKVSML